MEQYQLLKRSFFSSLQKALSYSAPTMIFVRLMGSRGGNTILREELKNKKLEIKQEEKKLLFLIDGKQCFAYEYIYDDSYKSWGVAYERIVDGRKFISQTGFPNLYDKYSGPNDPRLPEPDETILRSCNGKYLVEITILGKIPIERSKYKTKGTAYLHEWIVKQK